MENVILKAKYLDDLSLVKKALDKAELLHKGQYRDSKEEYIIHPISVFKILTGMMADKETLCAGLLHDTLEDTDYSKGEMISDFGADVFKLVDGVTKEDESKFDSLLDSKLFNYNKLALYSSKDVRVMIIKLADRLHNMRTISNKSSDSIWFNSFETMNYFVPMAESLGMNNMKMLLEDLSFKYLDSEKYDDTLVFRDNIIDYSSLNYQMNLALKYLYQNDIDGEIRVVFDGIYESYKKLKDGDCRIFTIYIVSDECKHKEDITDYIKTINSDEFDFIKNGIANGFKDKRFFDFFNYSDLSNMILDINDNYLEKVKKYYNKKSEIK